MRLFGLCFIIIFLASSIPLETHALTDQKKFVRIANYFLESGPVLDQALVELARYDLIVIPLEAQEYNQSFFAKIKKQNPDIVILAYVPTVSWNHLYWKDPLHQKLYKGIQADWWLTDESGKRKSVWPNTSALNLNTDWTPYLVTFVEKNIMKSGFWDGIFYDEVQDSISWLGAVDVDRNGKNDRADRANALWEKRYLDLFAKTREQLGGSAVIVINGSSNPLFTPYINGRMFETFPSSNQTLAEWNEKTQEYLNLEKQSSHEPVQLINVNTQNTGKNQDYRAVRFGLATTLLGSGYFGFDFGDQDHRQLWWYDEYEAYLGAPKETVEQSTAVLLRDFEQGKVIVNATEKTQTIELDGEYEKIRGTQDPRVNDGSIVSTVTVAGKEGLILLRPVGTLANASFANGSFARIFDEKGKTKRNGFFAYDPAFRGGSNILKVDFDHDGGLETIVADQTYISIYRNDGTLQALFAPYTKFYTKGLFLDVGDLEGDGTLEIVTGTGLGGGAHVRMFNQFGTLLSPGFFAYDKNFRGGVRVAVGDTNGDGHMEIITGAGIGGGPHVRLFNKEGQPVSGGFFAYDSAFRGGVFVNSGSLNGDEIDEIVTSPGSGLLPIAKVFDGNGNKKQELQLSTTSSSHMIIVLSDVDLDGAEELVGLTTDVFTLSAEN